MFHRIQQYSLMSAAGRWYRPRAYGNPQPDGIWEAWLVFFPLRGGAAIAPPHPETTQRTWEDLSFWATGLTAVYLEGALDRALTHRPSLVAELADAEYEALEDAAELQAAADLDRVAAEVDEAAAEAALADAERLHQERLAAETALAAAEEAAARTEAKVHEEAAHRARAVAAEAAERRRTRTR